MKSAYNQEWVYNLEVIKSAKQWARHNFISNEQKLAIEEAYKVAFYHPNLIIRLLLFVATLIAISGVTGLLALMVADAGQVGISILCVLYGIASFVILEKIFITKNHFKSGVTEAINYHACGFMLGGIAGFVDFENMQVILLMCLLVFTFAAIRYLDLVTTVLAMASLAALVFYNCFEAGGLFKQIIPFIFILVFSVIYFVTKKLQQHVELNVWHYNLLIIESICLILIYLSGNYLVVRELSVNLMDLSLEMGEDIPFAYLFYFLTVSIPLSYLYFGITRKDLVLLRVSLLVFAFSVFTFKYYFIQEHLEITLTLAGIILTGLTILLMRYLKEMRAGFTRENLMTSKWAAMNVEAILISQTMGGNQSQDTVIESGGGGDSGGGGASSSF